MQEEPEMIINGTRLTAAQSMTMRVAFESFMIDLTTNGLGDDKHGKATADGYLYAGEMIRQAMYGRSSPP